MNVYLFFNVFLALFLLLLLEVKYSSSSVDLANSSSSSSLDSISSLPSSYIKFMNFSHLFVNFLILLLSISKNISKYFSFSLPTIITTGINTKILIMIQPMLPKNTVLLAELSEFVLSCNSYT